MIIPKRGERGRLRFLFAAACMGVCELAMNMVAIPVSIFGVQLVDLDGESKFEKLVKEIRAVDGTFEDEDLEVTTIEHLIEGEKCAYVEQVSYLKDPKKQRYQRKVERCWIPA